MKKLLFLFLIMVFAACQDNYQLASDTTGVGGSLARFTFIRDSMYIVTSDSLKVYNITNPAKPRFVEGQPVSLRNVETLFSFQNRLFVGSSVGMVMYEIMPTGEIQAKGRIAHEWGCDPVVANDSLAFVSIRNGREGCLGGIRINEVQIIDIKTFQLVASIPMTFPAGVGLDKKILFVCDNGLKILDITNPKEVKTIKYMTDIEAFDVIPLNGNLLVIGNGKITQVNYHNLNDIKIISQFDLKK